MENNISEVMKGQINLETSHTGTCAPGTGAPGTCAPGTGAPGTCAPGTGAPGTGAPGTGAPTQYIATSDDISVLKRQIVIDDNQAAELLNKFSGNFVMAMLDFHQIRSHSDNQACTDITGKSTMARENTETELQDDSQNKYLSNLLPICDLLDTASNHSILKECRTHVLIDLTPDTHSFSKRKRFATLAEIAADYSTHLTPPEYQLGLNIYPVQGELLFRWSMINAGLLVYATQIRDNKSVVADSLLRRINKSATLIARSCGHIAEDHCIIDGAVLVNNLAWTH
jgi:hypothetical protein